MKRLLLFIAALVAAASAAHAGPFEWQAREDGVFVGYTASAVTASTSVVIIDLSDTVNYGHRLTGSVDISSIRADVAGITAVTTGTIKVGVVTRVGTSNGDVKWFYTHDFSRDAANSGVVLNNGTLALPEASIRTLVKNGLTPYMVTNSSTSATSTFNTATNLNTPAGTSVTPAVGDIVMTYTAVGATAVTFNLEIIYYTEK